jgi:hypothetical protein
MGFEIGRIHLPGQLAALPGQPSPGEQGLVMGSQVGLVFIVSQPFGESRRPSAQPLRGAALRRGRAIAEP